MPAKKLFFSPRPNIPFSFIFPLSSQILSDTEERVIGDCGSLIGNFLLWTIIMSRSFVFPV
jgi:hypothetical protein